MKPTYLILLPFMLLNSTMLLCYHEEVVFSKEIVNFSLDGDLSEWARIESLPIQNYTDSDEKTILNCTAKFKAGYFKNEIYFTLEITDNDLIHDTDKEWYEKDAVVLYFNFCSIGTPEGVVRVILNQDKVQVENHSAEKDPCNSFLSSEAVQHKFIRSKDVSIYELVIVLPNNISPFQAIGVDFQVLDVDQENEIVNEIYWCPGNHHRFYMPGKLGNLVFAENGGLNNAMVSGQVIWQDKQSTAFPLPERILVKSKKYLEFILDAQLDSFGRFNISLPEGEYEIYSAEKNTNHYEMKGYNNQNRINTFDKVEFVVRKDDIVITDTLKLRTYSPPDYLFQKSGVMHNYKEADEDLVNSFVQNYMAYYNIPAASLALIHNDEVVFENTYGTRNLLHGEACQSNSVFQIASVSKSIFAFIVMRLVEKKILDLDTPLYQYLSFENIAHNEGYKMITARLVLSHQTGLPNWAWGGPGGWESGEKVDLSFLPGTKYQYSGEGYAYLGRVVEHLTKKSLSELLEGEFKSPLGIQKLFFTDNDEIEQVSGHVGDNPTLWYPPHIAGVAHSILTDARSFAPFVLELGRQQYLKKETYQEMFTLLQPVTGFEHPDNLYWKQGIGLGFFTQESPFGKAVMHGGNNGDFQGEFVYYIEEKIGFVLFTNSNRGHKLGQELGRFLFYGKS